MVNIIILKANCVMSKEKREELEKEINEKTKEKVVVIPNTVDIVSWESNSW